MLVGELNPCNRNGARPILPYARGCGPRCFTELKPLRPVVLMPLPCRPRRDKWQRNGLRFSGQRTLPRDGTFISVAKAPPRRCLYRKLDSAIIMMKSAEDRHSCGAAYVLDGAMDRSVFAKRPMSPRLIIISGILRQSFGEAVLAKASLGQWACRGCPWPVIDV